MARAYSFSEMFSSLEPIFENSYVVESHLSEIKPRLVRVDEKGGTLGDDEDLTRESLYSERAFVHYEISRQRS
jgi:hypothetical protein